MTTTILSSLLFLANTIQQQQQETAIAPTPTPTTTKEDAFLTYENYTYAIRDDRYILSIIRFPLCIHR
jgi:hypothetical protein